MAGSNRRKFIQRALLSGAALTSTSRSAKGMFARTLSPAQLFALGEAILPLRALGRSGVEQVLAGFADWLAGYEPVGEMNHGYFTGEIRYSPEHPGPRWASQLEALELQAQKRFQLAFVELDVERRRRLVAEQISDDRLDRLPRAYTARHVAVGLLAYYYALPEATDLAYRAQIMKNRCRPLAMAPELPAPLESEGSDNG